MPKQYLIINFVILEVLTIFFVLFHPPARTRIVISLVVLTQPTNSQAIFHFSPRQSSASLTSRSTSKPHINPSLNINTALLSNIDISSPAPIQNSFSPTSTQHTSLEKTPCVERQIQGFSFNSSPHSLPFP